MQVSGNVTPDVCGVGTRGVTPSRATLGITIVMTTLHTRLTQCQKHGCCLLAIAMKTNMDNNKPVQPALAEGKSPKVLVYDLQELLGPLKSQWNMADIIYLHIMGAVHVVMDHSSPRAAEGLNCKALPLIHPGPITALHNGDRLPGMDVVGTCGY